MATIVWVIWNLEYHKQNAVPKKMRTALRSLIFLYPIMGSTWLFGLFSFSHHSTLVYQYLFSLFNAFQGFFMLLFHCILQPGLNDSVVNREKRKFLEILEKLSSSATRWRLRGILTCQINPLKRPAKAIRENELENEIRKIEYRKEPESAPDQIPKKPLMLDRKPLAPLVPKTEQTVEVKLNVSLKTENQCSVERFQ